MCMMELIVASCVHDYHVYSKNRTAALGEELYCEQDIGNVIDQYAIDMKKDSSETIGHLPQKISRNCTMFLQRGGEITDTVTGRRR